MSTPSPTLPPPKSELAPVESPEILVSEEDEAIRNRAQPRVERARKFKRSLAIYVLSLLVLTPTWVITQYYIQDGWPKHLSTRSRYPGDWDPWIIWVALIGAIIVVIYGYRAYFDRSDMERKR